MFKNKKGFTLIELLAVIVILAIIALVAVPIVLNMIGKARKQAAIDSTYGYIEAMNYNMGLSDAGVNGYNNIADGNQLDVENLPKLKLKGKEPDEGTVTIVRRKVETARICIGGYWVNYRKNEAKIDQKCNPGVKLLNKITSDDESATLDSMEIAYTTIGSNITVTATAIEVDENGDAVTGAETKTATVANGKVSFTGLGVGKRYKYTIVARDTAGNESQKEGTIVTANFNNINISVDDANWTKKKTITVTTDENLNGTGIVLQYKVGYGNWTNYTTPFEITENTSIYARLKKDENVSEAKTMTITKIDNVTIATPTATVTSGGYPTLTINGLEDSSSNTLSITYTAQEGTSPYYSIDNGTTWTKYTGEVTVNTTNVKAKLKRDVSGLEGDVVTATVTSQTTGALTAQAYDKGNDYDTTCITTNGTYYINVDSNVIGKKLHVIGHYTSNRYDLLRFTPVKADGTEMDFITVSEQYGTTNDLKIASVNGEVMTIPEETAKLKVIVSKYALCNLTISTLPEIIAGDVYPTLTSTGVISKARVNINYFSTSTQRLYKIGESGTWTNYTTPLNVNFGQTVYAKSILSNGKESLPNSLLISAKTGSIPEETYDTGDGYDTTCYVQNSGALYVNVDSSAIGKKLYIKGHYTFNRYDYLRFTPVKADGTEMDFITIGEQYGTTNDLKVSSYDGEVMTIPEETATLKIPMQKYALCDIKVVDN